MGLLKKIELIYKFIYYKLFKYDENKSLKYIEFHLAEHCNLNCAYCSHFSPLAEPSFPNITSFEKDIAKLSQITKSNIRNIRLLGGEPLLNSECYKFIDITRKYFPYSKISLVTNGVLLEKQNDDFWNSCRKNKAEIECTKYPINLDYAKIEKIVQNESIKFTFARGHEAPNKYFTKNTLTQKGKFHNTSCFMAKNCTFFKDGKIYLCPLPGNIDILNKYFNLNFNIEETDYIDIYKTNNIKEILNFLKKETPFCKYCDLRNTKWVKWDISKKSVSEWCSD